jgi:hypothetical protein
MMEAVKSEWIANEMAGVIRLIGLDPFLEKEKRYAIQIFPFDASRPARGAVHFYQRVRRRLGANSRAAPGPGDE